MEHIIDNATPADWPQIEALIGGLRLPLDGLREHLGTALVARSGREVVGCAALELYGDSALLRSVGVAGDHQGQGLGHDLTRAALDLARRRGVRSVYLLTETAADFFPRFGFQPADRADVPAAVQVSVEFTSACPVSARAMALLLEQAPA